VKIEIQGKENYKSKVDEFKHHHGIHKIIGFSGGSDDKLLSVEDDDKLQEHYKQLKDGLHRRIITDALNKLRGYEVAILTGGTEGGIPELAATIAKELGFKTIGVYPKKGEKYSLGSDLLDLSICVDSQIGESMWGDEGAVWTGLIDGTVVIGGGAGTLTECAHLQKINESYISKGIIPKFIVPIHGTGGVSDILPHIWTKPHVRNASMPKERIYSGLEASECLIEALSLEDYFNYKN
jgi:predicted Rossmann-fold nucleotide-binding protein